MIDPVFFFDVILDSLIEGIIGVLALYISYLLFKLDTRLSSLSPGFFLIGLGGIFDTLNEIGSLVAFEFLSSFFPLLGFFILLISLVGLSKKNKK